MKKLLYLLLLASGIAFAQNTKVVPDCTIQFDFIGAGSTGTGNCGTPNASASGQQGIAFWTLVYYSTGFSGLSLTVQSAPDSAGAPGSWGTFGGTVLTSTQLPGSSGINPNTATTSAFTGFAGYFPWIRVNLSGLTGSGTVKGALYGYLNSTIARAGSGGGGGGPTIAGTANEIAVTGAGCTGTGTCIISIPTNPILPGNASATGTFTAAGLISSETYSGSWCGNGLTSGEVCTTVADIAGTAIVYVWPSTNGTAGQVLSDSGVTTCPTLPAGYPSVCHLLAWIAAGGGSGGGGVLGFSASTLTLPSAGTTYLAPVGGAAASSTEANVIANAPAAAAISNMYVSLSAAPGTGNTVAFTFRDAGSSTAVTCTISGASATTCSDTTHSFTPTIGDALSIQVVTTGTVVIAPAIKIIAEYGVVAGPGGALILISKQTLASPASSVTFSGISGSYTDLILSMTAAGSASADTVSVEVRLNGDTASHYIDGYLFAPAGGSPSSGTNSGASATFMNIGNISAASSVSNSAGYLSMTIGNYSTTTFLKMVSTTWGALFGTFTGTGNQNGVTNGYWNSTAAVTSITVLPSSGNFVTGSVFVLYGRS